MNIVKPSVCVCNYTDDVTVYDAIERAGRVCYKSEDHITPDSSRRFVKNIIKSGHESVLEHVSISVKVTCDRGVSHEIVRHRIASYSQESTRYCNYSKGKFDGQVSYIDLKGGLDIEGKLDADTQALVLNEWLQACRDAEYHYMKMIELGATPQIARSVLNNSTKTDLVITMNLREWRHFFKLRCAEDAHPQMRELATKIYDLLYALVPLVFEDIDKTGEA